MRQARRVSRTPRQRSRAHVHSLPAALAVATIAAACAVSPLAHHDADDRVVRTDAEWREILTLNQFLVTRRGATEQPFTGTWLHNERPGTYRCVACGAALFDSTMKYDSGTGWPSFHDTLPQAPISIVEVPRVTGLGEVAEQVRCGRCDSHLGARFHDGPAPRGLRYRINSAALDFRPR